ncbi:MAG: hypothetical protein ABMA15_12245 [Vicinamibacterales bacterium]
MKQAMGYRLWALGRAATRSLLCAGLAVLSVAIVAPFAHAQMPDAKQMSGIPRPVTDLPNGSVSVRVIRGDMTQNLANQPVEMHSGGKVQTVNTDAEGRAQFDNLTPGSPVKFATVVDGERIESQEFPAQSPGGVRLLLVATDPNAKPAPAAPAAPVVPAVAGTVVIGGESRIIVETDEEVVTVYYLLDIVNSASAPVSPPAPFVFTLPTAANGTTVIRGSSERASNEGRTVTVVGPFPPGTTSIQVAAEYVSAEGRVELTQAFPADMPQVVVVAKKAGNMKLSSPQFDRSEETVIEGTAVVLGVGRGLTAGQTMAVTISGLPHHSSVPRTVALTITSLILIVGVWAGTRTGTGVVDASSERKALTARREKLFQDLVRLEHDHRRGRGNQATYAARREDLLRALEHLYGALDDYDAGPDPAKRSSAA